MTPELFWLDDAQMSRLRPLLPTKTRGKRRVDDRRVISGIIHVLKSGCRWIDAPREYRPRKTLYNRFARWSEKVVWRSLFEALAAANGPPSHVLIDPSAVWAHRSASGGKGGSCSTQLNARAAGGRRKSTLRLTASVGRSASC